MHYKEKDKLILDKLLAHSSVIDDKITASLSRRQLKKLTGIPDSGIYSTIKRLERMKKISVYRRWGCQSIYTIHTGQIKILKLEDRIKELERTAALMNKEE